jgi:hypothetical protein
LIGMPRPKKAKVDHLELKRSESAATSPATTATEEASPSGSQELDLGTREASVSEESKVLRKKVNDLVRKARAAVAQAAVDRRKAEAELRHEERRKEERLKRWEAAERRPEPPPAYLQLERLYKSQVKGLKAQLKLSKACRRHAEMQLEVHNALDIKREFELSRTAA